MNNKPFNLPPLGLIEGFEAAARNLSFTKAAEELFLTQSAISRQIKVLEERLGAPLFQRRTRALTLTEAGEALYRTVAEVLRRLEDTTTLIRSPVAARTFTVTTTPAFASLWLIPRLVGYTKHRPEVDVRISATSDVVDLERSKIELAIRYGGPIAGDAAVKLFHEEVFPVCSPALLKNHPHPLKTPADLKHYVLLHYEDTGHSAPWLGWTQWLQAVGLSDLRPAGALHFSHYDQVVVAAANGQGVALGRSPLLKRQIRERKLAAPFSTRSVAPRAYYVIQSAAASRNDDIQDFVTWLRAEAAAEHISIKKSRTKTR
jgi:LysR family transcriptional regulator, glycine cleavage system transcriptional activator